MTFGSNNELVCVESDDTPRVRRYKVEVAIAANPVRAGLRIELGHRLFPPRKELQSRPVTGDERDDDIRDVPGTITDHTASSSSQDGPERPMLSHFFRWGSDRTRRRPDAAGGT